MEHVQLGQSFSNLLVSLFSLLLAESPMACIVNLEMQLSRDFPPSGRAHIALYSMGT
jgi:hypothetical protein